MIRDVSSAPVTLPHPTAELFVTVFFTRVRHYCVSSAAHSAPGGTRSMSLRLMLELGIRLDENERSRDSWLGATANCKQSDTSSSLVPPHSL